MTNTISRKAKRSIPFNFIFRYIDQVHSLNNSKFGDYLIEMKIKDTTYTGHILTYIYILTVMIG